MPASETAEQGFSSGLQGPQDGQPFDFVLQGSMQEICRMLLTPPSAAAHFSDRGLGHAGSTAHEAASALTLGSGRANPLGARPVLLAPSRPRTAVPESETPACVFFSAHHSGDGILEFSMNPVFLAAFCVQCLS